MKKLVRKSKPNNYDLNDLENYLNLFDHDGKIRSRWNFDTPSNKTLKRILLEMSNGECSYCGKLLDEWDIDHFLPKSSFNYLSYCYENLLPSCKKCNQDLKREKFPRSLINYTNFAEEHIYLKISGLTYYNREVVLKNTLDRIVEPTLDIPDDHLDFNPITCEYIAKSPIGEETIKVFFRENKNLNLKLQNISNQVYSMIQEGCSQKTIFSLSKILGYSFYIEKIYNYWIELLDI